MRRYSVPAVVISILLQALPLTAWGNPDPVEGSAQSDNSGWEDFTVESTQDDAAAAARAPSSDDESDESLSTANASLARTREEMGKSPISPLSARLRTLALDEQKARAHLADIQAKLKTSAAPTTRMEKPSEQQARVRASLEIDEQKSRAHLAQIQAALRAGEQKAREEAAARAEQSTDDSADSEERSAAIADTPIYKELSRKQAEKLLGLKVKVGADGKLRLHGVTKLACYPDEESQRGLHILMKGNNLKILAAPGCDTREGLHRGNALDLYEKVDLSSLDSTKPVCLKDITASGPDVDACDDPKEMVFAGAPKKAVEPEAVETEEEQLSLEERKAQIAEAAEAQIVNCGRSNRMQDLLQAVDPAIHRLAVDVMGESRINAVFDLVISKAGRSSSVSKVDSHGDIDAILDRIHSQTNVKDEKILAVKIRMAEALVLKDKEATPEEMREALEDQIESLESLDLDVEDSKRERLIKSFKDRLSAHINGIERKEKVDKAKTEVPAATQEAYSAILRGDQTTLLRAQQKLGQTFENLGCAKEAAASAECIEIQGLSQQLMVTNTQMSKARYLGANCQMLQARDPNAKCEEYSNLISEMKANPMISNAGVLPQTQPAQLGTAEGSNDRLPSGSGNNAATGTSSFGFDILSQGSNATLKFYAPKATTDSTTTNAPAASPQNAQNTPANQAVSAPPLTLAPITRRVGGR